MTEAGRLSSVWEGHLGDGKMEKASIERAASLDDAWASMG